MTRAEGAHLVVAVWRDNSWMPKAACRDLPPALADFFFIEDGNYHQAKLFCEYCPVKDMCLEFGLEEQTGVWGGLDPTERRALRMERGMGRKAPSVTWAGPKNPMSVDAAHKRKVRSGR